MKYKRNSGREKPKELTEKQQIVLLQKRKVEDKLLDEIRWLDELNNMDQFSLEWIHKVAVELLLQCMGKKEVLMGFKDNEQLVRVFKEKPALEALGMIAKMNGHLFDTVKGTVKQTGKIEHEHTIELKPNANRTVEVFEILEACGALQPPVKQLSNSEVEQIHTA